MDIQEYKESGMLELYVYGTLNESDTKLISDLEQSNTEIKNEIEAIEIAILNLSSSFAPNVSVELFEKIRAQLLIKHNGKVIDLNAKKSFAGSYLGWAAAAALLITTGYLYNKNTEFTSDLVAVKQDKSELQKSILDLDIKNKNTTALLQVVRDNSNIVVNLGGQAVAPQSFAKVYFNKQTKAIYIDASGLPEPPEGMVYQVWALKMNPLTPTSIGLLENFSSNAEKLFLVDKNDTAEGFGITLEPKGGSKSPTMEQLYTLGNII